MNAVFLCGVGENEVDCINVAAILLRFDDGRTVALTEESLRRAGLEHLDASGELTGWLRTRAHEFSAGIEKPQI